jgi:glycosyltransferase involved in cell wall biosynthesis
MRTSVLVCTYGAERWQRVAERAAASARAEQPFEVITLHEPDLPLEDVRNRAAHAARGDWLCFLDGDDELEPGYLEAMAVASMTVWPALLIPAARYVDARRRRQSPPRIPNRESGPFTHINHAVIGSLVPRALFLEVGGFRHGYGPYEDWELWLRCLRAGAELVYVPNAVYRVHVTRGSRLTAPPRAELVALHTRIMREHELATGAMASGRSTA